MSGAVKAGQGVQYAGVIIIEWPEAQPLEKSAALAAWKVRVIDALTGKLILTVNKIEIHATANGFVTADLTLYADPAGKPLFTTGTVYPDGNGRPRTGVFPFLVSEMRVARPEMPKAALKPEFLAPPGLPDPV